MEVSLDNKKISSKSPLSYTEATVSDGYRESILASHLTGTKAISEGDYDGVRDARKHTLIAKIKDFAS